MKKRFCLLFVIAVLMTVFTATVFAENVEYFYVNSETGDDSADAASASTAVKTFTQACRYAEKSGADKAVIVITNEYAMPATAREITHTVPFVVTTNDGTTDYGAKGAKFVFGKNLRYVLNGDTTFENITIEYTGTLNCVAQYNHITFGENVTTTRLDSTASGLYVVGGWQSPENSFDATLDSHITIKSGSFLYVIGGSRQKAEGADGLVLTGTHYIEIEGGDIQNVLGASAQHNWSQNAVITMSGGKVTTFSVGGDVSRRLNGTATVTLSGGEIGTLNVNNVVGNATVNLLGTKVGTASVSYYNAEIDELRLKAKSAKTLVYDADFYTSTEIEQLSAGFDTDENVARVYAPAKGKGSGTSEKDPTTFSKAFEKAVEMGSTVVVVGTIELDTFGWVNSYDSKVVVTGDKIVVKNFFMANGEVEFTDISIVGKMHKIEVAGITSEILPYFSRGSFTFSSGVETSGETIDVKGRAFCGYSGSFGTVSCPKVVVDGADVATVSIEEASVCNVELISGKIGEFVTENAARAVISFAISGGELGILELYDSVKYYSLSFLGGKIEKCSVKGNSLSGVATVYENAFDTASVEKVLKLLGRKEARAFFVADGASGNGSSANSPASSLDAAYAAIGESGGTIVVCGKFTVAKAFNTATNSGKITFTSLYNGVDYAEKNGAEMIFTANFYCGGETEFNNITLRSNAHYRSIYANAHKLVIGEKVTSIADDVYGSYLSVMGGNQTTLTNVSTDLVINSGTWQRVRGGTAADSSTGANVSITINGGRFVDPVTLGSSYSHGGDITATVNGGVFQRGIYASTLTKDTHYFNSNVTLTINGGTFYGNIAPANSKVGTYSGTYNVTINGGYFAHLTELKGTDGVGTMTSTLNISEEIDLDAEVTGTYSFTNPIRDNGADPWLFYCDGYYYYTATTGSTVGIAKSANIGDMKYAEYVTIYDPEDGHEWSKNLWSPEIHYYTDEEIGEGNGGWYLFIACDDGDNVNHRMYVAKCLDGDDLLGRWGNPITGEVNVPQVVTAEAIPNFADTWAAGMSEIRINGKLYMLYITEADRDTANSHQTINIIEMTNPWTIVGESKVICYPEYSWEKGGYAYNTETGKAYPMVVEGSTAVYAEDGSVYIIYSGSGYWTTYYCLAQLKYIGGDPLEITSWEKSPEPILSKSDNINGCGHASYVTDTDGQGWVCYHAYIGKDTTSGRYAFVEPYFADANGVVIADGSAHPADIDTVYTVNLNPLPLAKRISGFDTTSAANAKFVASREYDGRFTDVTASHWFASYVENAYELGLANGTSETKFSPDNTFTVAQALTAAANIHTAYYGKTVRMAESGEAWYTPYVEYCTENGIITSGQFENMDANITRGDMAIVFANILPDEEYGAVKDGSPADVTKDIACFAAVAKLYKAGIVGGDAGSGNYRPADSIKRSEACVIFTRIALKGARAY